MATIATSSEVPPIDPAIYLIVPGLLLLAVLAASYLPAARAAGLDPAVTLRSD